MMGKADVKINVTLTSSNTVHAEVMFNVSTIVYFMCEHINDHSLSVPNIKQPRHPCTAYPVTSYDFTVTERRNPSNTRSMTYPSDASLILDRNNSGLEPDRVYRLFIEAANSVGRTLSEEILLCKHRSRK